MMNRLSNLRTPDRPARAAGPVAVFGRFIVLTALIALTALAGTISPSTVSAEAGGQEMQFTLVGVDRQQFYNPATGEGGSYIQRIGSDRPTGPFLVLLSAEHNVSFDITASHLTVTNGTLGTMTKRTASRFGWEITIIPNSGATSVSVTIAEDAFVHNLKGNRTATRTWSVRETDAPLVQTMVFTSSNAQRQGSGPYTQGQHIDLTLGYSEQVNVSHGTNKPYVTFDVNGVEKNAVYLDGSGTQFLRFRYTIESGFPSRGRAVPISANVNMPSGSAIKETKSASPQDALTALPPAPIYMETPRPTTSTDVNTPPEGAPGDTYQHRVRFNQAVKVRGTPGIALEFARAGSTTESKVVCSRYVRRISETELLFRYVVPRNHGLNLALSHSTKHGMCASNSSRITNSAGTQDATYYLYSQWDRVVRIDVGDSKRIWFALSSILPITVTTTFTNSHPSLITLDATSFTFTPENALTPQGLTITTTEDELQRGKSAKILYGIPEYSISGRDFLKIILEEPVNVFSTPLAAPTRTSQTWPATRSRGARRAARRRFRSRETRSEATHLRAPRALLTSARSSSRSAKAGSSTPAVISRPHGSSSRPTDQTCSAAGRTTNTSSRPMTTADTTWSSPVRCCGSGSGTSTSAPPPGSTRSSCSATPSTRVSITPSPNRSRSACRRPSRTPSEPGSR